MTDRELLELAAKAAGERIFVERQRERDEMGYGHVGLWLARGHTMWNPLTDDGDALRLAVKLEISVSPYSSYVIAADQHADYEGRDHAEVTRRAIVRAAAALAPPQEHAA